MRSWTTWSRLAIVLAALAAILAMGIPEVSRAGLAPGGEASGASAAQGMTATPDPGYALVAATPEGLSTRVSGTQSLPNPVAQPQIVIGPDERTQVSPTTYYPVSTVAYMEIYKAGVPYAVCTGVFIGPNTVITAAHCLYDQGTGQWVGDVYVVPGKDGVSEPYGYTYATNMVIPYAFASGSTDPSYNFGVLKLATSLGTTVGWLSLGVFSDATLAQPAFGVTIAGYPTDKAIGTHWTASKPSFLSVGQHVLTYDVDTYGEGGAGIRRTQDDLVVGVHSVGNATYQYNAGVRVDESLIAFVNTFCAANGCTYSVWREPTPTPAITSTPTITSTATATRTPSTTPTATPTIPTVYLPVVQRPAPPTATPTMTFTPSATPTVTNTPIPVITPNDPNYYRQWGLDKIGAPYAWPFSKGQGVVIAVVDSGVDLYHPDLQGKLVSGWDFVDNDSIPYPSDGKGHGTHVAGIAGSLTSNSLGIAGVGWDAQIMPVRVCGTSGCAFSAVADGIKWAVDHGAKVINLSLGSQYSNSTIRDAVAYAWSHGAVIIAASGNCGDPSTYQPNGCTVLSPISYPAGYDNVIGVGATTSSDTRASFSTYGPHVDIAAPGDQIYSTYVNLFGSTYADDSGTSMAAPFVSGAAALVWARSPGLTNQQVVDILLATAFDLGTAGRDDYFGRGRLDVRYAVQVAGSSSIPTGMHSNAYTMPQSVDANLSAEVAAGRVIVKLRPGSTLDDLATLLGGVGAVYDSPLLLDRTHVVRVPAGTERAAAAELSTSPLIEYAEPDYVMRLD